MDEDKFNEAMETVCQELMPEAEAKAATSSRTITSCLATLIRPHIGYVLDPSTRPKDSAVFDNRERIWGYKIYFWDVNEGMDKGELIAESENDTVRGFQALSDVIVEFVNEVYADKGFTVNALNAFSDLRMKKRFGGIRPAITRGGGTATMRIRYSLPTTNIAHLCQIDIWRIEKEVDVQV